MTSELLRAAKILGSTPLRVQGGGGNISEKRGSKMLIKASGIRLRDMAPGRGYAVIRYAPLTAYLLREAKRPLRLRSRVAEARLNAEIDLAIVRSESPGEPSMEAGMHAAIPSRYVFHTHSALVNVFACMKNGERLVRKVFGDRAAWVPYVNPGRELAIVITRLAASHRAKPVLILQNHGLLVHANTAERALGLALDAEDKVRWYLASRVARESFRSPVKAVEFRNHFIPDSAVYGHADLSQLPPKKNIAAHEIGALADVVSRSIRSLGAKPHYLSAADIRFIIGMEKEKKRMAAAQNIVSRKS